MLTSPRLRAPLVALAVAVTALGSVAPAQAGGRIPRSAAKAETKVTIKGEGGDYYGYVRSSDAAGCANGRTVKVFKQLGPVQDPKHDLKIGTDSAEPNGERYMWAIGNSGYKHGSFYAKVGKSSLCKGDTSKTITR